MRQGSLVPPAAASEVVMDIGRVLSDTIAHITEQANLPPAREATPCPARRESLARVTTASRRANVAYECGVSPGVLLTPARPALSPRGSDMTARSLSARLRR